MGLLAAGVALSLGACGQIGGATDAQGDLVVFPDEDFVIAGVEGGPVFPESKVYLLSNVGEDSLQWSAHSSHPSIQFSSSSGLLGSGESELVTVFVELVPNLPPGRYVADIVFENDETGTEEADPDAVLTISAANALEISPSIGFSSSGFVGGPFAPLSAPYVLGNAGSEPIDWSIEILAPWLSASLSAGQLAPAAFQNVTLSIDPLQAAQLVAANHNATVLIHDLTNGADLELIVTLAITEPARLAITPAGGFFTSGEPGGPFTPDSQTYTLRNTGGELLAWTAGENASWLSLSRTSGSLAPDQQTTVVASIDSAATSGLSDGEYSATLSFTNTTSGLGNSTRPVGLVLSSPPGSLSVTPAQAFSSAGPAGGPFQPSTKTYTLSNNGGMPLNWQALASATWLALSPSAGTLAPGASVQVVVAHEPNVAPFLGVGQYSAQVSFTNLTNDAGNTTRAASLNVSAGGGGGGTLLTPGAGFTGPTQEPGQIGSGSAKAIARWDVVPYQTLVEQTTPTFTVGVVAFHIAGIERVSFSLEGGPFVDATAMTLNSETGVWEYCATIDVSDFATDRPIELRAIAYPRATAPQAEGTGAYPGGGFPRLLDSLHLYVDADAAQTAITRYCSPSGNDSSGDGSPGNPYASPWKAAQAVASASGGSADGGIVYMKAGAYDWGQPGGGPVPPTRDRWLTFRPAPGITRDQVRIVSGNYPGMAIDRVRFTEVTLNHFVYGDDGGLGGNDFIWLDHSTCVGAGIGTSVHWNGWTGGFAGKYWTDVQVSDDAQSVPGGVDLARNVNARNVQYGPARPKLVVNCTWDTVNNGGTTNHPDFIHWNFAGAQAIIDNAIVYNVTATNIAAIGVFFKDTGRLQNVALVNLALQTLAPYGALVGENCLALDHFLMLSCTDRGGYFSWQMPQSRMSHISIRGSHFDLMTITTATGGDSVSNGWFDANSFGSGFASIAPGTHTTTSDPQFSNTFTPGPFSPLRGRLVPLVPVDKDGSPRSALATVGAIE